MKSLRNTLLVLALCSAGAQAHERDASLENSLAADGMTPISEGLYGRRDGGDESYVAYTPAGQQALLQRLYDLRSARASSKQTDEAAPNAFDRLIDRLGEAGVGLSGVQNGYGDCSGAAASGPFHVQAAASNGVAASARAENASNPTVATTNVAYAFASDPSGDGPENQSTAHGNTTASASSSLPRPGTACRNQTGESYASATVTCPGASSPAITAIAFSQVNPDLPCPR